MAPQNRNAEITENSLRNGEVSIHLCVFTSVASAFKVSLLPADITVACDEWPFPVRIRADLNQPESAV